MDFHPAANLFPMIEGDDFASLMEDVRANGLQEEIKLLDGKILDGRNRFRACEKAGVNPRFRDLPKATDPIRWVVSANIHRRHLNEAQRAMIAADIANMTRGDNKGAHRPGKEGSALVPTLNSVQPPVSVSEAAALMNVSERSVGNARKIVRDAVPEIVQMVKTGELGAKPAAAVSDLPKKEQTAAAKQGPEAVKRKAAEVKRQKTEVAPSSPPSASAPAETTRTIPPAPGEIKVLGVGTIRAHEAINSLTRIPKNDALRKQGFRLVTDWIRRNP